MTDLPEGILDLHAELGRIEDEARKGDVEAALRHIDDYLAQEPGVVKLVLLRWMRGRILVEHRGLPDGAADYREALAAASGLTCPQERYHTLC